MPPKQEAREQVDRQLVQAGWQVQSMRDLSISAARGVAVREFPLTIGFADYLLYADAKSAGHTLTGVETKSGKYLDGLPPGLHSHHLPLPFALESTGEAKGVSCACGRSVILR